LASCKGKGKEKVKLALYI